MLHKYSKQIIKLIIAAMLLSSMPFASSIAAFPNDAPQHVHKVSGTKAMNQACHDAGTAKQVSDSKPCCDNANSACEQDCSTCPMTPASAGLLSRFETEVFIHIAAQKQFTPLLFTSSALANLYRPPRLN